MIIFQCVYSVFSLFLPCLPQSFAAFVASKRVDRSEEETEGEGATSWCCCGQTFKEHPAIHKHVARTHDAEVKRLTQATYECLLRQLEDDETEAQEPDGRRGAEEEMDVSAWIPDLGHVSEEKLLK